MISYVLGLDVELVTSCFLSLFKAGRIHAQKKTAGEKKKRFFYDCLKMSSPSPLCRCTHNNTRILNFNIEREKENPWSWARNNNLIRIVVCSIPNCFFLQECRKQGRKKTILSDPVHHWDSPLYFLRSCCSDGKENLLWLVRIVAECQVSFLPPYCLSSPRGEYRFRRSVDNFLKVPRETWAYIYNSFEKKGRIGWGGRWRWDCTQAERCHAAGATPWGWIAWCWTWRKSGANRPPLTPLKMNPAHAFLTNQFWVGWVVRNKKKKTNISPSFFYDLMIIRSYYATFLFYSWNMDIWAAIKSERGRFMYL